MKKIIFGFIPLITTMLVGLETNNPSPYLTRPSHSSDTNIQKQSSNSALRKNESTLNKSNSETLQSPRSDLKSRDTMIQRDEEYEHDDINDYDRNSKLQEDSFPQIDEKKPSSFEKID